MKKTMDTRAQHLVVDGIPLEVSAVHTLVVGSGAAALKAACRLKQLGVDDLVVLTESVKGGTSYNTGSDKQTYYRLSTGTKEPDSPYLMAHDLSGGGAMHGDTALVEAIGSTEAFHYLCSLGVPFPTNRYGAYAGYQTDHDIRERGSSIGPYTSKRMVEVLLDEARLRNVDIREQIEVVRLITCDNRIVGAVAIDRKRVEESSYGLCLYMADNVVFATGGPGGIYEDSVYPSCHSGAIGLALEIGAQANNLTESQFGLASTKFRWNVSGSYQQVIPTYFSTDADGNDEREFLQPFFPSTENLCNAIFLKGYQWPFDVRKITDHGSSLIDILVYRERVLLGRRVFMDFRRNPSSVHASQPFSLDAIGAVARSYLEKSAALGATPYARLEQMNSQAIGLYREHGIDLAKEPLEVAVCAQHNNGGLSVDTWWESVNISHLFPIGEVAGTHGIARPGGSALNSGQVGAERASRKIVGSYSTPTLTWEMFSEPALLAAKEILAIAKTSLTEEGKDAEDNLTALLDYRGAYRKRMSKAGSMVRSSTVLAEELKAAATQVQAFADLRIGTAHLLPKLLQTRHLVLSHQIYLEAIVSYLEQGGGSRGSALVLAQKGESIHEQLENFWYYTPEDKSLRNVVFTTRFQKGKSIHECIPCRPIPDEDFWFETVWRDYVEGKYLT
ncbi:FAD-binding protein [Pleomorphochaeta sp. DL1XJH-081]|uniref:FAD-binding protein n=1 Tax=Pleomorphochaeta sp. DL1XJH-081 TaxID=3409690 RepID=UPI003BB54D07